ncbi:hypothetical protein OPV22_018848 [Ensete ventricosum]|uniref:GPI inositol-deacylase n=1 Tax=Ensete ventricosum TaxID=4639 RepID=A0AAV8R5G4_ENSVE|nr:hypothetical protein OPV22_018848 [Ensete ventricosum]
MSLLPTPPPALGAIPSTTVALRPVVILPGLGNNTGDYMDMAMTLREGYGIPSVVARVSRVDWLRHAAALLSPGFWRGSLRPRPLLDWYLERVAEAVAEAKLLLEDDGSISLVGHSAGGWLARVYMEEFGMSRISLMLTLGSPHLPPPKAVYTPELKYVRIAGRYIQGAHLFGNSNDPSYDPILVKVISRCAAKQMFGEMVLFRNCLLIFDGVYHSPVGSDGTIRPWFGSASVIKKWVHHLLS